MMARLQQAKRSDGRVSSWIYDLVKSAKSHNFQCAYLAFLLFGEKIDKVLDMTAHYLRETTFLNFARPGIESWALHSALPVPQLDHVTQLILCRPPEI